MKLTVEVAFIGVRGSGNNAGDTRGINCAFSSINPLPSIALDVLYHQPSYSRCGYFCDQLQTFSSLDQ